MAFVRRKRYTHKKKTERKKDTVHDRLKGNRFDYYYLSYSTCFVCRSIRIVAALVCVCAARGQIVTRIKISLEMTKYLCYLNQVLGALLS